MNATTHTEAQAIHTAANVLQAADPSKDMILVPLSRLVLRPTGRNVRKAPRMSIPELAASIQRVGLLQNLIVIPAADGVHYEVVAGGRRLAALKLLAKKHRIAKDWQVGSEECQLANRDRSISRRVDLASQISAETG